MFKAANPFDEIVAKATDENLTSENWQLNLDVCDKVSSEGENGARNCVAAILKRLVHRNANVQLYALTLSDALSKNSGIVAHRELASRSFCQTVQRIILDRNTHITVKKKATSLIKQWSQEWGQDESLGIVRETMEALRNQGVSFQDEDQKNEPAPTEPSSEQLRAEDEELRRVLELSLQDQGGRGANQSSTFQSSYNGSAEASSSSTAQPYKTNNSQPSFVGNVNKTLPDPSHSQTPANQQPQAPAASRVRALYDFAPSEEGELAFQKGDVIRILDSVYEHWWRGELRGEAGIFPVNYVELLPDPTPADIQREAELEAHIFAQANDIDRLLSKLRGLDPSRDNLADDDELQELYQSSLTMRPKIVKLIDRYNLKVTELRTMNDKFVRARATFDAMMEQNVNRYSNAGANGQVPVQTSTPGPFYGNTQNQSNTGAYPYSGPQSSATPQPTQSQANAQYPATSHPQQSSQQYYTQTPYQPSQSPSVQQQPLQQSVQQPQQQYNQPYPPSSQEYAGSGWQANSWYGPGPGQSHQQQSQQGYPVQ